jgi:hypothetical protein
VKVSFLSFDRVLASARLRQHIPMRELFKLGVEIGRGGDVLVCSKHGWPEELADRFERVVFDVCDDHFGSQWDLHYRKFCRLADEVVCNSDAMRFRIFQETQRVAKVIADPYESEESPPSWGEGLLWYGHETNLKDLWREVPDLHGYKLCVISNPVQEGITPWSPEAQAKALADCAVVILPTGKSPCKSANRMIEAIRAGKFVVANPMPAYEPFHRYAFIGNIREGVDWAHANQEEALELVRRGQEYVRANFSPEAIGKQWLDVLEKVVAKVAA